MNDPSPVPVVTGDLMMEEFMIDNVIHKIFRDTPTVKDRRDDHGPFRGVIMTKRSSAGSSPRKCNIPDEAIEISLIHTVEG